MTASTNDLSALNTMALSCQANQVLTLTSEAELEAFFKAFDDQKPLFVLSGGSNVLLPNTLDAIVLRPLMMGITTQKQSADRIEIEVMAGENWHDLVQFTVNQGWFGLENLALIPGLTGAAPVQNIGAYGVQLEDCLTHVRAFHIPSKSWRTLSKDDCQFGYRDSIFKREPNTWIITKVGFVLHKNEQQILTSYGDVATVAQSLAEKNDRNAPTPLDVMNAIIDIRKQKLPDPKVLPNCGSFFQNPVISQAQFDALKAQFPKLPSYPMPENQVKIAAGWLIDQAGLKGGGIAPILTHDKQALVLTNHAPFRATQDEVAAAQDFIIKTVLAKFGITISREPVWVNQNGSLGRGGHAL
ncbi:MULTISPECIES: UDP-N-acetylmuramate dehydrogenase [Psychrobacter]|uniref:UDP-N-acetylmuramate dehydrogenase n=1 Tax=Psychrobacter TaxID=497 RepID=UPI001CB6E69C|nr:MULTISPECIES: UDP-N-acetylmuramate dehydrogenase [Psychrobacter]